MFIATALVAVAAWVAKGIAESSNPAGQFCLLLAIPILLCAAVGKLAGRIGLWLRVGVGVDAALIGLTLAALLIAATINSEL